MEREAIGIRKALIVIYVGTLTWPSPFWFWLEDPTGIKCHEKCRKIFRYRELSNTERLGIDAFD